MHPTPEPSPVLGDDGPLASGYEHRRIHPRENEFARSKRYRSARVSAPMLSFVDLELAFDTHSKVRRVTPSVAQRQDHQINLPVNPSAGGRANDGIRTHDLLITNPKEHFPRAL